MCSQIELDNATFNLTFPIMNDTVWLLGPLGRIALSSQPNQSSVCFQSG